MPNIEYLIIYTNDGIPVYSHQFSNSFGVSDDVLLSAFLTSLNHFANLGGKVPENMKLENKSIEIKFSDELKLSTITIENTVLVFYYGGLDYLGIGVGVDRNEFGRINSLFEIAQLMVEIDRYMANYSKIDWRDVDKSLIADFEAKLLSSVVHNYIEAHDADDICFLEENCPYKLVPDTDPVETEDKSFTQKLKERFR